MRLCILLIFGFTLSLSARSYAQQERVTFDLKDVSVKVLLDEIQRQTNLCFLFNPQQTERLGKLSLQAKNETVAEVLNRIFKDSDLTFKFRDDLIVIMQRENQFGMNVSKEKRIVGRVTAKDKEPLPGVTVAIIHAKEKAGVALGTATNVEGYYALVVPDEQDGFIVRFSFVGMKSVDIKYTGQDSINVVMQEDLQQVNEVIVTGYQQIDRRHLTSAVDHLNMDDLEVPGVTRIDQLLEGRVPGLIFMQNSGQVGATPRLRIRGTSSILGNQEPLWVVDGIIQQDPVNIDPAKLNDLDFVNLLGNAIAGVNPADVESIDVLKDASATALYGARAANGVIVVTTKKGKAGPPRVSYSFSGSLTRRPRYTDRAINVMNSKERIDVARELMEKGVRYGGSLVFSNWIGYEQAYLDYYNSGKISYDEFKEQAQYYETINTDWFGILCQDVFSNTHSLSVSGGSDNARYYASFSYADERGSTRGERSRRYTGSIQTTGTYKKLTMQFGVSGSLSDKDYTPSEVEVMNYAYSMSRCIPLREQSGDYYFYDESDYPFNIVHEMENSDYGIDQKSASLRAQIQYQVLESLKLVGTFSYNFGMTDSETWFGEDSHHVALLRSDKRPDKNTLPFGGELSTSLTRNNSYTARLQADFSKFLDENQKHFTNASLGWEASSSKYKGTSETLRGYYKDRGKSFPVYNDVDKYPEYTAWKMNNNPSYSDQLTNMASGYLTLTYSYDDRYIFNVNTRADFSNAFGSRSNEKLFPVWSFSGRWNISDDILKNANWVDNMALRLSYGIQGNMMNDQPTRLTIKKGPYNVQKEGFVSTVDHFPNPDLRWEKTYSFNSGLDFSLFNNKVNGTVSWYYKKTVDAFLNKDVCNVNGVDTYVVNSGNVENQGLELSLNFTPFNRIGSVSAKGKRGFVWRFDPQIGQALNKLINKTLKTNTNRMVNGDELSISQFLNGSVQMAGVPLNTFYSFKFAGLDNEGQPTFKGLEKEREEELNEKYKTMENKDIWMEILGKSGTRVPVYQGGLYNYLAYRSFSLSFNLSYSFGNKVRLFRLTSGAYSAITPKPLQNIRREFVNRWKNPGDEKYTDIPGIRTDGGNVTPWWDYYKQAWKPAEGRNIYSMYDESDLRVVPGWYVRMTSATFTYVFKPELLKKIGMSSATLSLAGTNLFTLCDKRMKGQDPSQSGSSDIINISIRPTYTLNLNISF